MTPSYTSGCASPEYFAPVPEPLRRALHTAFSRATFSWFIWIRGENRRLNRSPPLVIHPVVGHEASSLGVKAGATAIAGGCADITKRCETSAANPTDTAMAAAVVR